MKKATLTDARSRSDTEKNNISEQENQEHLKVNPEQFALFFDVMFRNAKKGYITLRGFKNDGSLIFSPEGLAYNDSNLFLATERLGNLTSTMPGGVFCSPLATFKTTRKATEMDIENGLAISVDFDNTNPKQGLERLQAILGQPTLIIASRGTWECSITHKKQPKLHAHWRLSSPTETPEDHERLKNLRRIAAHLTNADPSAVPIVHPMRLPGSWHTKNAPVQCQILEVNAENEVTLNEAELRLKEFEHSEGSQVPERQYTFSAEQEFISQQLNTTYGNIVLENELLKLAKATQGERNTYLNKAAFCLGQHVANCHLTEECVRDNLMTTALNLGLTKNRALSTIKSGLNAGRRKPRAKENACASGSFCFVKAVDLQVCPPKWILESYLEENTLSLVFGDPGAGKSFLALDVAFCISAGILWHGKLVKQGSVFYIAGEGFNGITRRLKALSERYGLPLTELPLFVSKQPAQFLDERNATLVAEAVRKLSLDYGSPTLVIVDTLARNFGNGNENSAQDMGVFISTLDRFILHEFNCSVLVVHHPGHTEKLRARGSMALKGAVDAEFCIQKTKDIITMTTTKMKDGAPPNPISFRLTPIKIGILDEKQMDVLSAVLEPVAFVDKDQESIRNLIPTNGLNQTKLIEKIHAKLNIAQNKARELLENGISSHWTIEKGPKNSTIYKPLFSFSTTGEQQTEKHPADEDNEN